MNILIIVLLIVAEIVMTAFVITKKTDVKSFALIRLITDVSELAICLGMLFTEEVSFGIRFGGLFALLLLRVVFAGVIWLIKRKNEKMKNNFTVILGSLMSVLLIIGSLFPSFMIKNYKGLPTSGSYDVKMTKAILVDGNRLESFENDGSKREVPVYFYYPEVKEEENIKFPVVFFSHGAFGYYQSNTSTYTELAANGYIVVSVEHPYHSLFTKDTNGNTIIVNSDFIRSVMTIQNTDTVSEEEIFEKSSKWMELRLADMNFAIDTIKNAANNNELTGEWYFDNENELMDALALIDTNSIGLMGHSLGGATAVTLGRTRDDIDAVIDFDGTMLGEIEGVENGVDVVNEESYSVPLLEIDNESHHVEREEVKKNNEIYSNNVILDNAEEGFDTYIKGSEHMNYTDLPLIVPSLAKMLGTGDVDSKECVEKMNELTLEFFNCYLKGEGDFGVEEYYEFP